MKKIAIVGIQGLPANYGGFETMVENIIGGNCSEGIEYFVYCSAKDMGNNNLKEYKGAKLKYVNMKSHGIWCVPYYFTSMMKCIGKGYDTVLVLGCGGGFALPIYKLFSRAKIIVNIDGLEHRRDKWGKVAKWLLKTLEIFSVRFSDVIVADNVGIQNYVTDNYGKKSEMIAYGGDTVLRDISAEMCDAFLEKYNLRKKSYAISVCRIEPENNCHITLEAYSKSKRNLVFIGNWNRSEYGRVLRERFSECTNIKILDPIYNLDTLYVLRSNAEAYIHGHSAGGTNPSLVEAMFFGIPIYAFDCVYNIESTCHQANYYHTAIDLLKLLEEMPQNGDAMKTLAYERYTWKKIAMQYEAIY